MTARNRFARCTVGDGPHTSLQSYDVYSIEQLAEVEVLYHQFLAKGVTFTRRQSVEGSKLMPGTLIFARGEDHVRSLGNDARLA